MNIRRIVDSLKNNWLLEKLVLFVLKTIVFFVLIWILLWLFVKLLPWFFGLSFSNLINSFTNPHGRVDTLYQIIKEPSQPNPNNPLTHIKNDYHNYYQIIIDTIPKNPHDEYSDLPDSAKQPANFKYIGYSSGILKLISWIPYGDSMGIKQARYYRTSKIRSPGFEVFSKGNGDAIFVEKRGLYNYSNYFLETGYLYGYGTYLRPGYSKTLVFNGLLYCDLGVTAGDYFINDGQFRFSPGITFRIGITR